jgi:hypothetical protein
MVFRRNGLHEMSIPGSFSTFFFLPDYKPKYHWWSGGDKKVEPKIIPIAIGIEKIC